MMKHRHMLAMAMVVSALGTGWAARADAAETAQTDAKTAAKAPAVCPICHRAVDASTSYPEKAGKTLVRGAANTVLGWTELISEPVQEAKNGGNVFVGIGKGVGMTVQQTAAGLGELLTFWTPKVNNQYVKFATDCPIRMKQAPASP